MQLFRIGSSTRSSAGSAVHYLIANKTALDRFTTGSRVVADGEMISFEEPWTFGAPRIVCIDDAAQLKALKSVAPFPAGFNAFAVEGLEQPSSGQAYVLGGHIMRDVDGFRPYAAAVPKSFGGRFLARGGAVTAIAGAFVPERVVLVEFPTADDALAFYISDRYAPLLKIRLATTEARLVIVAGSGNFPARIRAAAEAYLRAAGRSSP